MISFLKHHGGSGFLRARRGMSRPCIIKIGDYYRRAS